MARCAVLTPAVADARFPTGPQTPACPYLVATPDGLYAMRDFQVARRLAESYVDEGMADTVVYL